MKAIINEKGILCIERKKGVFKEQLCPFNNESNCGDDCPLFWTLENCGLRKIVELRCAPQETSHLILQDYRGDVE